MAGRKSVEREEKRLNGISVPMRKAEKERIMREAERLGMSNAAFLRMLASRYFSKENV